MAGVAGRAVRARQPRRSRCRGPATASAFSRSARLIAESEALDFESVARGESHTWRATREFALLGEILGGGRLGRARCAARSICRREPSAPSSTPTSSGRGPRSCSSRSPREVARGVVARSVAALAKGPNRVLGYVENMSGYYCRDCDAIKPLLRLAPSRRPGDPLPRHACRSIPSWPRTAIAGTPLTASRGTPVGPGAGSDRAAAHATSSMKEHR